MESKRVVSSLLIGGIAVVFILSFGPGSSGFGRGGPGKSISDGAAAVVNGKEIPAREFGRRYAQQLQMLRGMGTQVPEAMLRQWVPQQVLEQLVNTELLAQAAEKHGIVPSDVELARIIHAQPDFQKNGQFDLQWYYQVVRDYHRKTPQEYEADLRRQLAASKMQDFVQSTAVVSVDEVRARYDREGDQAELTYVRFLPAFYADKVASPSDKELAAFQKDSEKAIADEYEKNRFTYHQSEQVHARHILIRVAPEAPAEKKAEAKQKLENLRQEITGGKDFAELARQFSEDVGSREKGGDLGFNERGAWVPAFAEAAFTLKVGEVSQPVETPFGYHLVKVEEKRPPQSRSLDEVRPELARVLYKKEKAKQLARAAAQKAIADAKAGKKTLAQLFPPEKDNQPAALRFEQETRPEAVATEQFSASGDSIPRLGIAPELVRAVFAQKAPGVLDGVYTVGDALVVGHVTSRKLPSDTEFDQKKAQLLEEGKKAKEAELSNAFLEALKKQGQVTKNEQVIAQLVGQG